MSSDGKFHKQFTEPEITDEDNPPPIPKEIGPYKIEALLDRGGMGWLYMGVDPKTKQPIAIKVLPTDRLKDESSVERFLEESRLIGMTNHPNIVKLYEEGRWDGGLYIAMEWIHGVSLKQFLTQQSFSLRRSLHIILQIAEALKHLHSHNIIHRDLKPENILICEDGSIKVIDFGIAQMTQAPTTEGSSVAGTPNYMSPEQKKAPHTASFASDIYSLGVLAYELVLGKLSFGVIQTSLLPKQLSKIINKALAVSVKERYQTIDAFTSDLAKYLESKKIDQEKPDKDQTTEVFESLENASLTLVPTAPSPWEVADIGIGKVRARSYFGLYYDLFPMTDNTYALVIADPKEQNLSALLAASSLKGTMRALFEKMPQESLTLINIIDALKEIVAKDPSLQDFSISALYLNPKENTLSFFNSGLSQLIRVPAKEESKLVYSSHPSLNTLSGEVVDTKEPWNVGDILLFHSFAPEALLESKEQASTETLLRHTLKTELFLSAQSQADALVQACEQSPSASLLKRSKVLFTIQRMV